MEHHHQQLLKHCRICGGRLCKAKGKAQPVYKCIEHKEDLHILGVDVSSGEDEAVLPQYFCNPCHSMLCRAKKASEDGVPYQATTTPMKWTPHTLHCEVKEREKNPYMKAYTPTYTHARTMHCTDLSAL